MCKIAFFFSLFNYNVDCFHFTTALSGIAQALEGLGG